MAVTRMMGWLAVCAMTALIGCGGDDDGGQGGSGGSGATGGGGSGAAGGSGGSGGSGGGSGGSGGAGGGMQDLMAMYQAAVMDASMPEASEIVNTLTALDPANNNLVFDGMGRVLMITWTSYPGYDALVGQETPLGVEVWATPGREMQTFCQGTALQGAELSLRLEQLLGLPPDTGKDRVVELWVPLADMFRPSADPEIDDTVAQLDFPANTDPAHIDWITNLRATSYGANGYPWTQLGYTYDWEPDPNEVGLSEFVIRQGTTVQVESVTPQDTYCQ